MPGGVFLSLSETENSRESRFLTLGQFTCPFLGFSYRFKSFLEVVPSSTPGSDRMEVVGELFEDSYFGGSFIVSQLGDLFTQDKTSVSAHFFLDVLRCCVSTFPSVSEDLGWHVVMVTDSFQDPTMAKSSLLGLLSQKGRRSPQQNGSLETAF